jgi:hypothetical protein
MPRRPKTFGANQRGDEPPDWVADKQARLVKIREAKAELEAEAKAKVKLPTGKGPHLLNLTRLSARQ